MGIQVRHVVKWGLRALGGVTVLLVLYLSVFLLPYPLFPHHFDRAGFSVYSDQEFPADFSSVLDDARLRLEAMELYRGDDPPRIFMCQSERLFKSLCRLAGKRHSGQGLLISLAGNAFISAPGIAAVAQRCGGQPKHSRLAGSWAAAIAHETNHYLVFTRMGFAGVKAMAPWNAEGYADFQANLAPASVDPEYDLRARIAVLLDDANWRGRTGFIDRRHFRWHVLVEYLYTVKGITFRQLIVPELTEEAAIAKMMRWYEATDGATPGGENTDGSTPATWN